MSLDLHFSNLTNAPLNNLIELVKQDKSIEFHSVVLQPHSTDEFSIDYVPISIEVIIKGG